MTGSSAERKVEQVLVRLPSQTYAALQLAQPFVQRRSMQDLMAMIIDGFLDTLRAQDPGYQQALTGLHESQARRDGVLTKRGPRAVADS
jgi:hypothetical protein